MPRHRSVKRNNMNNFISWAFASRKRSLVLRPVSLSFEERKQYITRLLQHHRGKQIYNGMHNIIDIFFFNSFFFSNLHSRPKRKGRHTFLTTRLYMLVTHWVLLKNCQFLDGFCNAVTTTKIESEGHSTFFFYFFVPANCAKIAFTKMFKLCFRGIKKEKLENNVLDDVVFVKWGFNETFSYATR